MTAPTAAAPVALARLGAWSRGMPPVVSRSAGAGPLGLDEPAWVWPVDLTRYDRSPVLTAAECAALASLGDAVRGWRRHPLPVAAPRPRHGSPHDDSPWAA